MNNYIVDYHAKIQSGEVIVGKWIRAIYNIIINGIENGDYIFDAKKANKAIKFIETFCHHCEGRNDLLKLELWQKAIVSSMFGLVDENGLRIFREVFIVVARKNGKSLFASAIIAYMSYFDGEHGAKVFCLAPKLEQANIVFLNFYQMLQQDEELKEQHKKRRNDIYLSETNTSIRPLAFNAKKSDGFNPHLVINDELASWRGDGGLKQYEVMKSALGARRQPIILSISTAGYENNSIYDELMTRSTAFLNGTNGEKRLLPFLYKIDDEDVEQNKWKDINVLKKANPNMGISVTEAFYKDEVLIAEGSLSKKAEFLTKYCNIKQNSSIAWLDHTLVMKARIEGMTLSDFVGSHAVGGIDLSQSTDLTAASVVIERNGKLYGFCQFFMPANRLQEMQELDGVPYTVFVKKGLITLSGENYINYKDVLNWYIALFKKYKIFVLRLGYDRWGARQLVDELEEQGFRTDDVRQGENLTPVVKEFEGIIKDGNFYIPSNALLESHFLNVAMKQNAETNRVAPIKIEQRMRIDGFISIINAMTVRQKYWNEIKGYFKHK